MWTGLWISWGILCVIALAAPEAKSIPVVPNFQQGTLKSTTTTTQKITEVINSYDYRTGYELTVSGTNIKPVGGVIAPHKLTKSCRRHAIARAGQQFLPMTEDGIQCEPALAAAADIPELLAAALSPLRLPYLLRCRVLFPLSALACLQYTPCCHLIRCFSHA